MVEFSLVINDTKTGISYSKKTTEQEATIFRDKKIKDVISGNTLGLKGYELEISGGSDKQGFPMRHDLDIGGRKKILLSKGPGVKIKRHGMRKRKAVRGSKLSLDISQINLKVVKYGVKPLAEIFGKKETAKEEKPKEVPKKEEEKDVKKE